MKDAKEFTRSLVSPIVLANNINTVNYRIILTIIKRHSLTSTTIIVVVMVCCLSARKSNTIYSSSKTYVITVESLEAKFLSDAP